MDPTCDQWGWLSPTPCHQWPDLGMRISEGIHGLGVQMGWKACSRCLKAYICIFPQGRRQWGGRGGKRRPNISASRRNIDSVIFAAPRFSLPSAAINFVYYPSSRDVSRSIDTTGGVVNKRTHVVHPDNCFIALLDWTVLTAFRQHF